MMRYTQAQYVEDNKTKYTQEQLAQFGKVYTDLMYKDITLDEAQSTFNVPKDCGVYKNMRDNVNQLRRQISRGAPMWNTPIEHIKAIYTYLKEEDKEKYVRNVMSMAYRYEKTSTKQWSHARQDEIDDRIQAEIDEFNKNKGF